MILVLGWPLHSGWSSFHVIGLKKLKVSCQWLSGTRPNHPNEIWKRRFISTVWPTIKTYPSRKRKFLKILLKPDPFKLKHWFCVLMRVDGEIFGNDNVTKITWFPWPSSPITNPNWALIVALLISPTYNVDAKKHLMHFRRKNTVSKFLRSVY